MKKESDKFSLDLWLEIDKMIKGIGAYLEAAQNCPSQDLYAAIPQMLRDKALMESDPEEFLVEDIVKNYTEIDWENTSIKEKDKRTIWLTASYRRAAWIYALKALAAPTETAGWKMILKAMQYASLHDGHSMGRYSIIDQRVEAGSKAGKKRQAKNIRMRQEAYDFLDKNQNSFSTKIAAAQAITKVVEIELPTAQQWVRDWHKARSTT